MGVAGRALDRVDQSPPKEACGVFGVYSTGAPVAFTTYVGLQALQHRGEESAGIAVSDGHSIRHHRDLGLVREIFSAQRLEELRGYAAIGHTRYSTSGPKTRANAQPVVERHGRFAVAHNGNLVDADELAEESAAADPDLAYETGDSDSYLISNLVASALDRLEAEGGVGDPILAAWREVLPELRGAFTLVMLDRGRLIAARDRHGLRPLVLGRLDDGWLVASESSAVEAVGASVVRPVEPGELVTVDADGVKSLRWTEARPRACLFEYVYFTRADSELDGRSVYEARFDAGRRLAVRAPRPDADYVVGVPDAGTPAALGFAAEAQIPFAQGFVRSSYAGRTFIQPAQHLRLAEVGLKLKPIRAVVDGKRLVVVDDSIVRGSTQQLVVRMLRAAGAAEIHLRIASPPIRWPCFYGFDFSTREELVAAERPVDEIAGVLGVDSLAYLPLADLVAATGKPRGGLCRACMDGRYPHVEERRPVRARRPRARALTS